MNKEDKITVEIQKSLYKKVERRIKTTKSFDSPSQYIEYVLRQFVPDIEDKDELIYNKNEEEIIKKRLRDIGYI